MGSLIFIIILIGFLSIIGQMVGCLCKLACMIIIPITCSVLTFALVAKHCGEETGFCAGILAFVFSILMFCNKKD